MHDIILQIGPSIGRQSFGVGYVIAELSAALCRAGANVYMVTTDSPEEGYERCELVGFPRERLICHKPLGHPRFAFAPSLSKEVRAAIGSKSAVVQVHGLWTYTSWMAGMISREARMPLVVMPHGELDPGALAFSRAKKAIAELLFVRRNVASCSCTWALTDAEKKAILDYGYNGRIAVIPNGVNDVEVASQEDVAAFRRQHNLGNRRILLYLSRITRKKDIPLLLKSFAGAVKYRPEWILVLAGGDEKGHLAEVQRLSQDLGIAESVRFTGLLFGWDKKAAFTASSIFVLPSSSEGLPIVALEAMGYGKPLVLTNAWDLPVPNPEQFCWRLHSERAIFEAGLAVAMSAPEDVLKQMGHIGKATVHKFFSWDNVARQAIDLYASLGPQAQQHY